MTTAYKSIIRILLIGILFHFGTSLKSQEWVRMMQDTSANFYDIVKEFDAYWKDRPYERGHGYNAFRRWQWLLSPVFILAET